MSLWTEGEREEVDLDLFAKEAMVKNERDEGLQTKAGGESGWRERLSFHPYSSNIPSTHSYVRRRHSYFIYLDVGILARISGICTRKSECSWTRGLQWLRWQPEGMELVGSKGRPHPVWISGFNNRGYIKVYAHTIILSQDILRINLLLSNSFYLVIS